MSRFSFSSAFLLLLTGLVGNAAAAPGAHRLRLSGGHEDALQWAAFSAPAGQRNFAVALSSGPVTPRLIDALTAAGAEVLHYLPDDALLIRLDGATATRLRAIDGLQALRALPARLKVSPALAVYVRERAGRPARADETPTGLLIRMARGVDGHAALSRFAADPLLPAAAGERFKFAGDSGRGARLLFAGAAGNLQSRAAALAADPDVEWIEPAPEFRLFNDAARWVGQNFDTAGSGADASLGPVHAHNLRGEGQVVGIIDDGLDPTHNCFFDAAQGVISADGVPNYNQRKVIFYHAWDATKPWNNCSGEGHGSHTAGTVACDFDGNGVWDAAASGNPPDGMAPAAKLAVSDNGTTDPPGIPADLAAVFGETYAVGARVHSNSWGSCGSSASCYVYTSQSQDADQFMWEHPEFLILFAAANEGGTSNTVTPPGTAKNIITIGATNRGTGADTIASFSSRGPTADGRLKPELTAPGVSTNSARDNETGAAGSCTVGAGPLLSAAHGGATGMSGTSMATPAAAGYAALLRQYFTEGFYPSGAKVAADGVTPSAALLKAALINGARKMTGHNLPGNEQGFGRISLKESLYFNDSGLPRKLFVDDHKNGLVQGDGALTYRFNVTDSATPFKITLVWTDAPPALIAGTAKALVNDLNLRATEPGGAGFYLGNTFTVASGFSTRLTSGGSLDNTNVVEEIWVNNPPLGEWTLTVTPQNIPIGPQPFALVVSGAYQTPVAGTPGLDSTRISDAAPGNNDGAADPGESVDLQTVVRELAGTAISNLSGTLTSLDTAKATIVDGGPQPFGTLPAGASAFNAIPFKVQIPAGAPCGALAPLRLTLTDGVDNWVLDFGMRLGAPGKTPALSVIDNFDASLTLDLALWLSSGRVAVDNSIVTFAAGASGANAVRFMQNNTAPGSVLRTQTLNLSAARTARLDFSYWANNIAASSSGPFFRVEACVGPVASTCAAGAAGWQLLYGNPNHYSGASGLNFNSNTLTPKAWTPISIDLTGTTLIGATEANLRFRFSQTGSATEATTAVYVDSVNLTAYSYACSQPAASQLLLMADKSGGQVHLSWSGGTAPYSLFRLRGGLTESGPLVTTPVTYDENLLNDGLSYMWRVE